MTRIYLSLAACALALTACDNNNKAVTGDGSHSEVAGHNEENDAGFCMGSGPQTPQDISQIAGANLIRFELAPAPEQMNLCNIHTHTNAEHKAPGFSVFAGDGRHGGYQCNETVNLTEAELAIPVVGKVSLKR